MSFPLFFPQKGKNIYLNLIILSVIMKLNLYFLKFIHKLWINFIYNIFLFLDGLLFTQRVQFFMLYTTYTQFITIITNIKRWCALLADFDYNKT